ncbi:MAG: hypothetical protein COA45_06450 [Zetaproteobacteria bacterium]|nr:MAG: hypothetical protein COA45_06450 [Zetaproteobacteria bacterium]
MGEKGSFTKDDFSTMSKDAQSVLRIVFDKSEMKRRFDNDPAVAQRMSDARGEGKLVSVYGAFHFDRQKGDIDASLGEERTATIRINNDGNNFMTNLSSEFDKVQALYGYDMSDTPDVTIDLSEGSWTDKEGNVIKFSIDDAPSFSNTISTQELGDDLAIPKG